MTPTPSLEGNNYFANYLGMEVVCFETGDGSRGLISPKFNWENFVSGLALHGALIRSSRYLFFFFF